MWMLVWLVYCCIVLVMFCIGWLLCMFIVIVKFLGRFVLVSSVLVCVMFSLYGVVLFVFSRLCGRKFWCGWLMFWIRVVFSVL